MNCLIVGYGSIGRRRSRLLRDMGHQVSVFDVDGKAMKSALADGFFLSHRRDFTGQVILVCTPPETHLEIAADALGVGRDSTRIRGLFIEKPLTVRRDELLWGAAAVPVMVACNWRFSEAVALAQPFARSGYWAFYFGHKLALWRPGAEQVYTHGPWLDDIHELDLAQHLAGPIVAARAWVNEPQHVRAGFDHAHGVGSWVELDFDKPVNYERSIAHANGRETVWRLERSEVDATYRREMTHFLRCVERDEVPMNGLTEAMRTTEIALALTEKGEWP